MSVLLWQHLGIPRPSAADTIRDYLAEGGMPTFELIRCNVSLCAAQVREELAAMVKEGEVFSVVGEDGVERWALVRS